MNLDKPLTTGTVTFTPDKSKGNEYEGAPSANVNEDGTYTIYTEARSGAPVGWYKVTVFAEEPRAEDDYSTPKYLVPQKYIGVATTPLSVEVKPGGSYDLTLEK